MTENSDPNSTDADSAAQSQPPPEVSKRPRSAASRDPLHGLTLETMLTRLVDRHGWPEMGYRIPIRCFLFEPSVKSSLAFLRRTPWARKKVEDWYAYDARRYSMEPAPAENVSPTIPPELKSSETTADSPPEIQGENAGTDD
jgi:uncharacterized protein (DUF2132 family)